MLFNVQTAGQGIPKWVEYRNFDSTIPFSIVMGNQRSAQGASNPPQMTFASEIKVNLFTWRLLRGAHPITGSSNFDCGFF